MKVKILKFSCMVLSVVVACFGAGCGLSSALMMPPPLHHFGSMARTAGADEMEIVFHNAYPYMNASIFVNGQKRFILKKGEIGTITVPNGRNIVYVENSLNKGLHRSKVLAVNAKATRIVFQIGVTDGKFNLTKCAEYPFAPSAAQLQTSKPLSGPSAAIRRAGSSLIKDLPQDSKIAVVSVTSNSESVLDELEYVLVTSRRFFMTYRGTPEDVSQERAVKVSNGNINDDVLLAVGHIKSANIVVASTVTESGGQKSLSLRALNVKTGRVMAMARETY
jgi:hypothetical protein